MSIIRATIMVCVAVGVSPLNAQGVSTVLTAPVDHPVALPHAERSAAVWKNMAGQWGESFVEPSLKLRGFDVVEAKAGGNRGIDRIAIKRNAAGELIDVKLIEVKAHRGRAPRLSQTRGSGRQMQRKWLADRLRMLRNSGDPELRTLAREVSNFRRNHNVPIERLGELHEINTRTGRYIVRDPTSMAQTSNVSAERHLTQLQRRGPPETRRWAAGQLASWDQVRTTSMSSWLDEGASRSRGIRRGSSSRLANVSPVLRGQPISRVIVRSAGPLGIAVSTAMDAHEVFSHVRAYQAREIHRREMVVSIARSSGGIVGAGAGAWAGAKGGALAGAAFGPWGVGIGGAAGGLVGGVTGYYFGSASTEYLAEAWYESLDESVRNSVNGWWMDTSYSDAQSQVGQR